MSPIPFSLETPRLLLRRLRSADVPTFLAYRNDPVVGRYQSWSPLSEEQALAFIVEQSQTEPGRPGPGFQCAIERRADGRHIGDCFLKLLDDDPEQALIGYTLEAQAQGQGYATEAVARLLDYCFASLGLHRVVAFTACANTGSVALLERLGFRREGHTRQSYRYHGVWEDEYLYAVLAEEWRRDAAGRAAVQA